MATLSPDQIAELVTRYGFADRRTAIAVVLGESGGRTDAINRGNSDGSIDRGLWQINSVHSASIAPAEMFDVEASTAFALRLSSGGTDFNPWSVTRSARWPELYEQAGRVKVPGSERDVTAGDIIGEVPVVGDAAAAVGNVIGAVVNPAADVLAFAGKALSVLVSADFWKRAGFVVAGLVLAYLGFAAIFGRDALAIGTTVASRGTVSLPDPDTDDD